MQKSKALKIVLAVGAILVVAGGVLLVLGIFGMQRFDRETRIAEASNDVRSIARGASRCAGGEPDANESDAGAWRGLPSTSNAVPPSIAAVSGKQRYASTAADWSTESWRCIGFDIQGPQRFQYRWAKRSELEGVAEASGDLDGDGTPDVYVAQEVHCATAAARTTCDWTSPRIDTRGNAASAGLR